MVDAAPSVQLECEDTLTSEEQQSCEENVLSIFQHTLLNTRTQEEIALQRERHVSWLKRGLESLPPNFAGLLVIVGYHFTLLRVLQTNKE